MDTEFFIRSLEIETHLNYFAILAYWDSPKISRVFSSIPQCNSFAYKVCSPQRFFSSLVMATRVPVLSPG